jgi:hypothetical protein
MPLNKLRAARKCYLAFGLAKKNEKQLKQEIFFLISKNIINLINVIVIQGGMHAKNDERHHGRP